MVHKIYRKLTAEQKAQGIVFTSTLSKNTQEMEGDVTHAVTKDMTPAEQERRISNLKDDRFFSGSIGSTPCPWKYNIIRSR